MRAALESAGITRSDCKLEARRDANEFHNMSRTAPNILL